MRDILGCALAATVAIGSVAFAGCSSSSDSTGDTGDDTTSSSSSGGSSGSSGLGTSSGSSGAGAGGSSGASSSGSGSSGGVADDASDDDGMAMTEPDATLGDAGHHPDASTEPDSGPAHDSGPGLTTDASTDESAWLDPMNAARAAVMANEPPLTWNPIAAEVALAYAQNCNYVHNPNRSTAYKSAGGGNGGLGENIAAGTPMLTIAGSNKGWIDDEKPAYDYSTNTCNTAVAPECGHYTQIVWKTTTSVGCALVTCNVNSPFDTSKYGTKWGFAVCDYAPPGNIVFNGTLEKPY